MKQVVIISGKGGTGKTSLVASLASLAGTSVLADCDVDAADLHLVVKPSPVARFDFIGGKIAVIDEDACTECGLCETLCRYDAIRGNGSVPDIDPIACEGCGVCAWFCPERAIDMVDSVEGEWYRSETRFGPMVHARLNPAGENSGKLVSLLRAEAKTIAEDRGIDTVLIDGSPGIGCPVIASMTGADLVLVVTEPTLSGLHDFERVVGLTRHFGIPAQVVVNKFDINETNARRLEELATSLGAGVAGRIRFDPAVTEAQVRGVPLVEITDEGAAQDVAEVWKRIEWSLSVGGMLR
ncbi:MAG: ATP-binding protein [Thermoanaerobaculales bacterium]|jgi:MinD superfamily P-loop ATPase|nr:ATP-binding protein [Thermoanaerobaculales bacterium]